MTHPCHKCMFLIVALCLLTTPAGAAQSSPTPPQVAAPAPQEMRGLWVVRDSLTSPAKIRHVVTMAKAHGFNALFVQVRGRGDAFYQSDLEPARRGTGRAAGRL